MVKKATKFLWNVLKIYKSPQYPEDLWIQNQLTLKYFTEPFFLNNNQANNYLNRKNKQN